MKTLINILLLLLLLVACTSTPPEKGLPYTDFPETKELSASTQSLDTALVRYPFRIRVQGDKAVVMDLHGTDCYFHLFYYPDFRYQSSFGKLGDSPEEMLSAENIRWSGQSLWVLDANKSELNRYGFDLSSEPG